jgi:hypothetical protein
VKGVPEAAKELMWACWGADPKERPSFPGIFNQVRATNYQMLPGVDGAEIKKYVDGILSEEAKHPARRLDTGGDL